MTALGPKSTFKATSSSKTNFFCKILCQKVLFKKIIDQSGFSAQILAQNQTSDPFLDPKSPLRARSERERALETNK